MLIVALTAFALPAVMFRAPPAEGSLQRGDRDCSLDSGGNVPLTDLGADLYQGAQGGLYPSGSNDLPPAHLAVGLARAAEIVPRAADGTPDPDGKVALASIGMSNTYREFGDFESAMASAPNVDPALVLVNAAQGGQDLSAWVSDGDRSWEGLDAELAEDGVTAEQVQAVWVKLTDRVSGSGVPPFPDTALNFRNELSELLGQLHDRLPNLQVAYLSSRIYGGYNATSSPSPEPLAYEEGFGVKWTIERQMNGDAALAADPDGPIEAPWIAWGPYMWADGTTPRDDGLTWTCRDFRGDGVHPVGSGTEKVAGLLMDFFADDPTPAWMWSDRTLPDAPADPAAVAPPSTIAGDTEPTATTDAPSDATDTTRGRRSTTTTPDSTTLAPPTTASAGTTPTDGPTDSSPEGSPPGDGPATGDTATPAAAADDGDGSSPPPVAWMLLGAGLTLAIVSGAVWLRSRR
jgi:hypothetical protein